MLLPAPEHALTSSPFAAPPHLTTICDLPLSAVCCLLCARRLRSTPPCHPHYSHLRRGADFAACCYFRYMLLRRDAFCCSLSTLLPLSRLYAFTSRCCSPAVRLGVAMLSPCCYAVHFRVATLFSLLYALTS
jgi:hypothetical protein